MAVIHDSESELPELIKGLLVDTRRRQQRWIDGVEGDIKELQHPEMTICGPFGGPARLIGDMVAQAAARAPFQGGTGEVELVRVIESGDLVVLILLERSMVQFAGREEPHPWDLRVTEVYQREGGRWQRLHRHADPLTLRRDLDATLALLADQTG
jgi:hypothetical protein